jgi:uncharacterized protein
MPDVMVRPATSSDLAAIRAINAAGQPGVTPFDSDEVAGLASGAIRCWVADTTGRVAGYLIAYRQDETCDGDEFAWFQGACPSFLYVDQIAVAPAMHRAGAGSALYYAATAYAAAQGLSMLTCEVNLDPPNPISLAFHRHLGFAEVGTLSTSDGRSVTLLTLPLPAAPAP